jgi:acetyl esterase/lipase
MKTINLLLPALFFALGVCLNAAEPVAAADAGPQPTRIIPYKKIGDVQLMLHVFEPPGHQADDRAPAIVLFFGGAWRSGKPSQLYPQCAYLAARGVWAASAEYRVKNLHHTTPVECVKDGKSAMRYLRTHAAELGLDPARIAAGGASAGGHVAAATATITAFDEDTDDPAVSAVPAALVLFNPVYDNGPGGWGHEEVAAYWREISPLHNIRKGMPPTIVFLGREDKNIPVATAQRFQNMMCAVGARSELHLYDGMEHGFFNAAKYDGKYFRDTMQKSSDFLVSLGLAPPPSRASTSGGDGK